MDLYLEKKNYLMLNFKHRKHYKKNFLKKSNNFNILVKQFRNKYEIINIINYKLV